MAIREGFSCIPSLYKYTKVKYFSPKVSAAPEEFGKGTGCLCTAQDSQLMETVSVSLRG